MPNVPVRNKGLLRLETNVPRHVIDALTNGEHIDAHFYRYRPGGPRGCRAIVPTVSGNPGKGPGDKPSEGGQIAQQPGAVVLRTGEGP